MFKKLFLTLLGISFLAWGYFKVVNATQDVEPRAYCHATSSEEHPYNYLFNTAWVQHLEDNGTPLSGHEKDFFTEVGDTDCNPETPVVTPTATPSATLTPTPFDECDQDECEPTPTPTETPEPTVTPTPTPEATPTPQTFSQASAPQGPACEAPIYAPTVTFNGRKDADTVSFSWTTVKDGLHTYLIWYGTTKDNLPWNTIVNGESVDLNNVPSGNIWMKVAGYDNGCVGKYSLTVDP